MSFKAHLFICTNSPDKNGKCGHKNSDELRRTLKDKAKEKWGKDVRINSSGCLGHCEKGIVAVIYPQNQWFFHLTDKDDKVLWKALKRAMGCEDITQESSK